ncbi:protein phosphatase 2C [Ramicandelaber brevisporus]|nr:protein phosphatase 2C [Ramicandelaber brevisporus]
MGQTLSEPVVNKLSSRGGDKRTAYGASAMQGWRVTMEDAHTALPNVFAALNAKNTSSASGGSGSPGSSHKSASSSLSSSPNRNSAIVDSPPSPPSTAQQQQQQQQGDASSNNNKEEHFGFYAVFDGHGGNSAAQYAAEFLHKNIISQDEFKAGDYEAALKKGFLTCDEQFYEDPRSVTNPSGCTAITALFTPDGRVFVANAASKALHRP